jgi:hypothetical protein
MDEIKKWYIYLCIYIYIYIYIYIDNIVAYIHEEGPVYAWVCGCKRNCHQHVNASALTTLRQSVWTGELSAEAIKDVIWETHQTDVFKSPVDNKPMCLKMLGRGANCSNNFLYYQTTGKTSANNSERSRSSYT